jgi:hypothetical protein
MTRVLRSNPENSGEVGVAVAMEGYQFMRTASGAEPDVPPRISLKLLNCSRFCSKRRRRD